MKALGALIVSLVLCACSSDLVRVHQPRADTGVAISDAVAADFVQTNNVYASFSNRGNPRAWKQFRSVFAKSMSRDLLLGFDKYMSLSRDSVPAEDDWWFQRGVLYLDGNIPWRCRAQRVGFDGKTARYRVIQEVHTSKGSFGRNDPIFFTVSLKDGRYVVDEIFFAFDPAQKWRVTPDVSVFRFFQYAAERSR
jgi:hypothetical protein